MLRLKELRQEERLTQKELAEKIGVAWYNVGDWERGKAEPSIRDLIRMSVFFDCLIDYLVGRNDASGDYTLPVDHLAKDRLLLSRYNALDDESKEFINTCIRYAGDRKKP